MTDDALDAGEEEPGHRPSGELGQVAAQGVRDGEVAALVAEADRVVRVQDDAQGDGLDALRVPVLHGQQCNCPDMSRR